jgi:CheY-like chemotaxis protein
MRLRILRRPRTPIDGFAVEHLQPGLIYEVGVQLACVLLADGSAEPAPDDARGALMPEFQHRSCDGVVLVIDDDADLRAAISTLLRLYGYTVVTARDGREGLERLCERCADVIVLDLNMPLMNGWQFRAEQQRLEDRRLAEVPVLLLTAEFDAARHASALKAAALIEKPLDVDQLLRAVQLAIDPARA